jgi:hypothetical protein
MYEIFIVMIFLSELSHSNNIFRLDHFSGDWSGQSEADHEFPSSTEIKNARNYTSTPRLSSWHGT